MSVWDKKVAPLGPALAKLSQPQRFELALACIDDVRETFNRALRPMASREANEFFVAALGLVSRAGEASDIQTEPARKLLDGMFWLQDAQPGVWDMAMCLFELLRRAGGELSVKDLLNSIGCAYQVVQQAELLWNLEREVTESELETMEEENSECMRCIANQILHISNARNGREVRKNGAP